MKSSNHLKNIGKAMLVLGAVLGTTESAFAGRYLNCSCSLTDLGSSFATKAMTQVWKGGLESECGDNVKDACHSRCGGNATVLGWLNDATLLKSACSPGGVDLISTRNLSVVSKIEGCTSRELTTGMVDCANIKILNILGGPRPSLTTRTNNSGTSSVATAAAVSAQAAAAARGAVLIDGRSSTGLSSARTCPTGTLMVRSTDGSFRCEGTARGIAANRGSRVASTGSNGSELYVTPTPSPTTTYTPNPDPTNPPYNPTCRIECSNGLQQVNNCRSVKGQMLAKLISFLVTEVGASAQIENCWLDGDCTDDQYTTFQTTGHL